jgi:hypothetical protein
VFDEPLLILKRLSDVFATLRIEYCVGGSFAGGVHGIPRSTQDVDVVVTMQAFHVPRLVAALVPDFYISDRAAHEAITLGTSFNVIHVEYAFKADLFVPHENPWTRSQLDRAVTEVFDTSHGPVAIRIVTAEDILLQKLSWYRQLGESSDQQWRDILGIYRISGDTMSAAYLDEWGRYLRVADLLERVRATLPTP